MSPQNEYVMLVSVRNVCLWFHKLVSIVQGVSESECV